jgi:peroxiredoxin
MNKHETAIPIILPSIDGGEFDTSKLIGKKYLISFFRFATCPFCNLRVHELVKRNMDFGSNFTIAAIFDSSIENLKKHTSKHNAPFAILADETNKYYKLYGVKKSFWGMINGMVKRFPTLMKSIILHGNIPLPINGSLITMPAEFLVNEKGEIAKSYYGRDEGDHLPLDEIIEFSK